MSVPGIRITLRITWCAAAIMLSGCRMGVPLHVWQPPQLESTVGRRVAVSQLAGPEELAEKIGSQLIATAPRDAGRETELVDAKSLQPKTHIQLVSATDQAPNDVALAAVARREEIDFVLRGEILADRYASHRDGEPLTSDQPLTISWRLTSLTENRPAGGQPVTVDIESAVDRYPDLGLAADKDSLLATAMSRDTLRLITPWIDRQRVSLAIPYLLPGSKEIRRGNAAALAGRWAEAEAIWQDVIARQPAQVAALHNLALAAVARQDFSMAKTLGRKAVRRQPSRLHKNTLVWIELRQRDYHEAFHLPDPPEGWFVTRGN